MNEILYNSYNQKLNLNIDNNQRIYKTNSNTVTSKTNNENSTSNDSIEITAQNQNIINTKKAHDAFKEACSNFGYVETSNGNYADMSLYYNRALTIMEDEGISVPSFIPDSQNSTSYLSFIEKVQEFAKTPTAAKYLPADRLTDFCDLFKEKLIQYDCK
jgi:hypothetical protein